MKFSPHYNPIFGNFEEFRGKIFDLRAKTFEKKRKFEILLFTPFLKKIN